MSLCASRVILGGFLSPPICMHKRRAFITVYRQYATHRDATSHTHPRVDSSSLLSQALNQKQRTLRREDTVGPFQLGLSQPSYDDVSSKKWSELSPKGKGQSFKHVIMVTTFLMILAMRATARTTNLTVILFGAGLTAILVYALTSELVSRNSPTVLYEEACQRIRSSSRVCDSMALYCNTLKRTCAGREISTRVVGVP
jgi:import inner membrane translocase subunit TIM21